jgi:hypothetical protein
MLYRYWDDFMFYCTSNRRNIKNGFTAMAVMYLFMSAVGLVRCLFDQRLDIAPLWFGIVTTVFVVGTCLGLIAAYLTWRWWGI